MKIKLAKLLMASALIALPITGIFSEKATAELPMEISFDEGYGDLTVPDQNTAQPYAGRLRRYDLHIAKMFEVTAFFCDEGLVSPGIEWSYHAGNGSIDMGNFYISCQLANDITYAYKVTRPQPTRIWFAQGEGEPIVREYHIGILNLTEGKVTRWLNFVQGFKPIR
jgi:serine/threonine-protein kinase